MTISLSTAAILGTVLLIVGFVLALTIWAHAWLDGYQTGRDDMELELLLARRPSKRSYSEPEE